MLLALCCASFSGCASKEPARAAGPPLETEDVHFYRHSNEPTVFRVSKTTYCVVLDMDQMNAFGGPDQIRVVAPSVDFKRGKKPTAAIACPRP